MKVTIIWDPALADGSSSCAVEITPSTTLGQLKCVLEEQFQIPAVSFCDFNEDMEELTLLGDDLNPSLLIDDDERGPYLHINPPVGAVISCKLAVPAAEEKATFKMKNEAAKKGRDAKAGGGKLTSQEKSALKDCSEILPGFLFVSGQLGSQSHGALQTCGITHVLNCCDRVPCKFEQLGVKYHVLHIHDTQGADITPLLGEGIAFIEEARCEGGRCLVHCMVGASRSVSVVLAYLVEVCDTLKVCIACNCTIVALRHS